MANITKVYLLSVPLEKDYLHTLYFSDSDEQQSYFQQRIKRSYTDFSYQRKDDVIRIPEHVDTLRDDGCNYVMYQNSAYSNRWFYAFITDMQYVNDGRTDVKIQTDCIQTWMFKFTVNPSFVEREHAKIDGVGENTVPEGLETGEFIVNRHTRSQYADDLAIVIGITATHEGVPWPSGMYNGIWSGIGYVAFDTADHGESIRTFLAKYDEGYADSVSVMFMCPKRLVMDEDGGMSGISYSYTSDKKFLNGESADMEVGFSTLSLDGYTPRNKKLMGFPYRYLHVSNNSGADVVYQYELFYKKDGFGTKTVVTNPEFLIEGALCPGCSIRMVPMDYKGVHRNDAEGINMGKFPVLNWVSDAYTNWLTQNGVNIAISLATGVGQIAAGIGTAIGTGGVGTVVGAGFASGGVSTITNTLAQIHTQSFTPAQAKGNINAGDVVTASGQNDFHFYDMTVKKEYAYILDEFFDMYGYKVNRVKIPYTAHRKSYWYTKTIDANITGNIPQEDLQVIKDCYNRGITFWRSTAVFRNYNPAVNPNSII